MINLIKINTERPHIYSPDIHVGITATINKYMDTSSILKSLKYVQERHPLLKSTIYFDKDNTAYYNLEKAQDIRPIIEDDSNIPWYRWIIETNAAPFDVTNDTMLRFHVSRNKHTTCFIALGHHMLGDGLSYAYFMRDFLCALDNNLDNQVLEPTIIKDETCLPKRGHLKLLSKLYAKKLNNDFKKNAKIFNFNDYKKVYQKYRYDSNPAIAHLALSSKETKKIITNCKNNKVTVNEAITSAFLYARNQCGIPTDRLGLSCNIRNELTQNPKESMGNYVSGFIINTKYETSIPFWENAKSIGRCINTKLKDPKQRYIASAFINALDDSLIDSINYIGVDGYKNEASKKLLAILTAGSLGEGTAISNLGKLSISAKSFEVIDFYFVPPLFTPHDFVVGVITTNNILTITVRYPLAKYSHNLVERIIDKAKKILLSIC